MTVIKGHRVPHTDFNELSSRISDILNDDGNNSSVGYGNAVTAGTVAEYGRITGVDWNNLRDDINKCRLHQTGAEFSDTELPLLGTYGPLTAEYVNKVDSCLLLIAANPLTAYQPLTNVTNAGSAVVRGTSWGTTTATTLTLTKSFAFSTADAARYFFNAGGAVRVSLSHPTSASAQDVFWNQLLSGAGTFSIGAATNSTTGSGTVSGTGFYGLTTTEVLVFQKTGSSPFNDNILRVYASVNGSGTTVTMKVVLTDGYSNSSGDSVQAGTSAQFSYRIASVMTEESPSGATSSWVASEDGYVDPGGPSATVSLTNHSTNSNVSVASTNYKWTTYQFTNTGYVVTSTPQDNGSSNTSTQDNTVGNWISTKAITSGEAAAYDIKFELQGGSPSSGNTSSVNFVTGSPAGSSSFGTWYNLATTREMGVGISCQPSGSGNCVMVYTATIRDASTLVELASATFTITAASTYTTYPAQIFTYTDPITLASGTNYDYTSPNGGLFILQLANVSGGIPGGVINSVSLLSGSLPPGATLSVDTFYSNGRAAIHGTPTTPGTYNFTAQVVWSDGITSGQTVDIPKTVTVT